MNSVFEWLMCMLVAAVFLGLGYLIGETQGAIAAHKGEIVCVNIPFREDRWECGEP